jgi:hypothetical protein
MARDADWMGAAQVRDLLGDDRGARLEIQNTKGSGTNVPEAIQIDVNSSQDVIDVMAQVFSTLIASTIFHSHTMSTYKCV